MKISPKNKQNPSLKQIRNEFEKNQLGYTKKERFTNFFFNQTGMYSAAEVITNWFLLFSTIAFIITTILLICFFPDISTMSAYQLQHDYISISFVLFTFIFLTTSYYKIRFANKRKKYFRSNGQYQKYTPWVHSIDNPKNTPGKKGWF